MTVPLTSASCRDPATSDAAAVRQPSVTHDSSRQTGHLPAPLIGKIVLTQRAGHWCIRRYAAGRRSSLTTANPSGAAAGSLASVSCTSAVRCMAASYAAAVNYLRGPASDRRGVEWHQLAISQGG
jgi:hypothetical protein